MGDIKNAIIESTMLGKTHGIMTFIIYIKFDKCIKCGVGLYALDEYNEKLDKRVCNASSMEVISEILDVVGVKQWEDLPGKYIRIEDNSWGSKITKIGNIIEDKWIDFEEFFEIRKGVNND